MGKFIDLSGRRFGKLLVVERVDPPSHGRVRWLCRCDCGAEKVIPGGNMTGSQCRTRSCGCEQVRAMRNGYLRSIREKQEKETPMERIARHVIRTTGRHCKKIGRVFALSVSEVVSIISSNCLYCGSSPLNTFAAGRENTGTYAAGVKYNGIDRIDSKRGYTIDNVVACCKVCNRYKSARSVDDFYAHCAAVAARRCLIFGTVLGIEMAKSSGKTA